MNMGKTNGEHRRFDDKIDRMERKFAEHEKFCEGEHAKLDKKIDVAVAEIKGKIDMMQIWDKLKTIGLITMAGAIGSMLTYIIMGG